MVDHVEIEVKFFLPDPQFLREKIFEQGGVKTIGKNFEKNIRFEDDQFSLVKKNTLLRLRKDNRARLTYKSPPLSPYKGLKARRELEVEVDDFDTMRKILEAIGFQKVQVYEKWRETYQVGDAECCIDKLPFGNFLEIEGPGESIARLASAFGLPWQRRIVTNYLHIFEIIRRNLDLDFTDVTFDNFGGIHVDPSVFLSEIILSE